MKKAEENYPKPFNNFFDSPIPRKMAGISLLLTQNKQMGTISALDLFGWENQKEYARQRMFISSDIFFHSASLLESVLELILLEYWQLESLSNNCAPTSKLLQEKITVISSLNEFDRYFKPILGKSIFEYTSISREKLQLIFKMRNLEAHGQNQVGLITEIEESVYSFTEDSKSLKILDTFKKLKIIKIPKHNPIGLDILYLHPYPSYWAFKTVVKFANSFYRKFEKEIIELDTTKEVLKEAKILSSNHKRFPSIRRDLKYIEMDY